MTEQRSMVAYEEPIYDAWTPLDYKHGAIRRWGRTSQLAPSWTDEHRRRLTAYNILRAYLDNAARRLMPGTDVDSAERRDQHREYGDAAVVVSTIRSALLGDNQEIVVDGAELFDPEAAEPEEGEEVDEDEATEQREAERASDLQEWLRSWAELERLPLKVIETEDNAVGLGDGVYTLGWSTEKGRPRIRVWDPAVYFPVLEEGVSEDDFPRRVHLAWEVQTDEDTRIKIRRITWELAPIRPVLGEEGEPLLSENGTSFVLREGDRQTPDGIVRDYPWNDEPSNLTCYLTDATWELDSGRPATIDDLSQAKAVYAIDDDGQVRERDIGIDFIPVVHVPNTVALIDHFGRSSLATVLQILDDLAASDTDLQAASGTTGTPVVGVFGARTQQERMTWRPGQLFEGPSEGRMDVMDTSSALDALLKYVESLLKRLAINARLPESVLGRVKPEEVPSGIALRLQFGPLERMVGEMRLVRKEKYPLLLKFAWRMAVAGGDQDAPEEFLPARIAFGSFLPADLDAVVAIVERLLGAGAISLETAVGLLIEAGMSIDDAAAEVRRIEARDFEGANQLLDATGSEQEAFDYLGLDVPEGSVPPTPPPVDLPGGET